MIIHITTSSGKDFKIELQGQTSQLTVGELKQKITDQEHIPREQQKLSLAGKKLSDNLTLAQLKIFDKTSLRLQVQRKAGLMNSDSQLESQHDQEAKEQEEEGPQSKKDSLMNNRMSFSGKTDKNFLSGSSMMNPELQQQYEHKPGKVASGIEAYTQPVFNLISPIAEKFNLFGGPLTSRNVSQKETNDSHLNSGELRKEKSFSANKEMSHQRTSSIGSRQRDPRMKDLQAEYGNGLDPQTFQNRNNKSIVYGSNSERDHNDQNTSQRYDNRSGGGFGVKSSHELRQQFSECSSFERNSMMEPQAIPKEHISSFEGADYADIYHGGMPEHIEAEECDELDQEQQEFQMASHERSERSSHLRQTGRSQLKDKHTSTDSDLDSRDQDSMEFDGAHQDKQCGDEDGPYEKMFAMQIKRQRGGANDNTSSGKPEGQRPKKSTRRTHVNEIDPAHSLTGPVIRQDSTDKLGPSLHQKFVSPLGGIRAEVDHQGFGVSFGRSKSRPHAQSTNNSSGPQIGTELQRKSSEHVFGEGPQMYEQRGELTKSTIVKSEIFANDKEPSVKSHKCILRKKPSQFSRSNDFESSNSRSNLTQEDPRKVAEAVMKSVNSAFASLVETNPTQALENIIKLALRGLSFNSALGILVQHGPTKLEEGEDAFRELFEQLLSLNKDFHDTKMGLVKELEECEQQEEILNNKRIMEEQERKLLLGVQDMIKKMHLETQLRYQQQMGKNFQQSSDLEEEDFRSNGSRDQVTSDDWQMVLASHIRKQNEGYLKEIKPKIEHDKGDIRERMDILAGQKRRIVLDIQRIIKAKHQQLNATKDWNFQLCDLDFDVFMIFLAGPQFFLIRGKNDDLIFFSHQSLRKVQEFYKIGQIVDVTSSNTHIAIALHDATLLHFSARTLEYQKIDMPMPGEIAGVSIWQDQIAICALQMGEFFQLIGVRLDSNLEEKSEKKSKQLMPQLEESIVTDSIIMSAANPYSKGSTPGQLATMTPGGNPSLDGPADLMEGEHEGSVHQVMPFKTLPYFLVRIDNYIQVFKILQADVQNPSDDKQFAYKYERQVETNATIVAEIKEGKFLLYNQTAHAFLKMKPLRNELVSVRFKHVHETTIKDIALHPLLWGKQHQYAVYLSTENTVHKVKVEFERGNYQLKVNSLEGEAKLLNLVEMKSEPSKLILLQIEEHKNENDGSNQQTTSRITKKVITF